jgi:aquaporin NIP
MKKYLAEFIGTFILMFCGTGAIIVNQETNGVLGHLGICITFGLVVMSLVYAFGGISGAHFNPAVTLALAISGDFKKKEIAPYIGSQVVGALLASFLLKLMFPANMNLGATLPSGSLLQSFILEVIITFILMLVVLGVTQSSKETGWLAGIVVGSIVLALALFAGPISGASMNPARSFGPAVVSGNVADLWLYIIAPILGAILAVFTWKAIKTSE